MQALLRVSRPATSRVPYFTLLKYHRHSYDEAKPSITAPIVQQLLAYQKHCASGKPVNLTYPCPCVSTLQLEEGIRMNQWLRLRAGTPNSRQVVHEGKVIGRVKFYLPKALPSETGQTEMLLCPYYDPGTHSIRFWSRDGGDVGAQYSFQRVSNKALRAFGELALAEGLVKSLPEKAITRVAPQDDGNLLYQYELSLKQGYSGPLREWVAKNRHRICEAGFIKTLVREKVLATKQQLLFHRHEHRFRTGRLVYIDALRYGSVEICLPLSAFPKGTTQGRAYMYFNRATQCLRFCTLDGEDIPESRRHSLDKLCLPSKRWLLLLAQAEGLVDKAQAARLDTFDLQAGIASGFYIHCRRTLETRCRLSIRFADGTTQTKFTVHLSSLSEVKGLPYIDGMEQLRFWDIDRKRDAEMFKNVFSMDGIAIRIHYPKLFTYAQSLGYWKSL